MTNDECFEVAKIRIQSGSSIRSIVKDLYSNNYRRFERNLTDDQRALLKKLRLEYTQETASKSKTPTPRMTFVTSSDTRNKILNHCKNNKLSVSRFVNKAAAFYFEKQSTLKNK